MSWSISIPRTPLADFPAALDAAATAATSNNANQHAPKEAKAQIDAATTFAKVLARLVVSGDGEVYAALSGHANPGHAPTAGYARDEIRVTVSQA